MQKRVKISALSRYFQKITKWSCTDRQYQSVSLGVGWPVGQELHPATPKRDTLSWEMIEVCFLLL